MAPKLKVQHVKFEQSASRVKATVTFRHKPLRAHDCSKIASEVARNSEFVTWSAFGRDKHEAFRKLGKAVPALCVLSYEVDSNALS